MSLHVCAEHGFAIRVARGEMRAEHFGRAAGCATCDLAVSNAGRALDAWTLREAERLEARAAQLRRLASASLATEEGE